MGEYLPTPPGKISCTHNPGKVGLRIIPSTMNLNKEKQISARLVLRHNVYVDRRVLLGFTL